MKQIQIPKKEMQFTYSRSSGAGGQNVNKVNTKVTLRWNLLWSQALSDSLKYQLAKKLSGRMNNEGEIQITSQRFRSQSRNMTDCIDKLHRLIRKASEPIKRRKKTRPTRASVEKRIKDKKSKGEKKRNRSYKPDF